MRNATNTVVSRPYAPQAEQQAAAGEDQRQRDVLAAILGGMSNASSARARAAERAADRQAAIPAPRDPTRFVCQPPAPYTGEVVCRERP